MRRLSRRQRWLVGGLTVAVIAAIVWALVPSGGALDSADDDGYLGLRLLLTERGASVTEIDADSVGKRSVDDFDVIFVMTPAGVDRTQLGEWHQYVAAGGRLILGQPDAERPKGENAPSPRGVVQPGECNIDASDLLGPIHSKGATPHHVHSNERSCFGNGTAAIVTSAVCRKGDQVTLATPALFDNATMGAPVRGRNWADPRGNARLAVSLFETTRSPRIGIVTGGVDVAFDQNPTVAANEPRCADVVGDDDSLWKVPGAPVGPQGGDGSSPDGRPGDSLPPSPGDTGGSDGSGGRSDTPPPSSGGGTESGDRSDGDENTGAGSAKPPPTIFDFLSPGLKLALAQLFALLLWYAWRRSRRDGVVVEDRAPVELRSSRLVEAVGALRRRGGETERAGEELRAHTRRQIATSFGLSANSSADDIAVAVTSRAHDGRPTPSREELVMLLGGRPVGSEEELVSLATQLREVRDRLSPGRMAAPPDRPLPSEPTA